MGEVGRRSKNDALLWLIGLVAFVTIVYLVSPSGLFGLSTRAAMPQVPRAPVAVPTPSPRGPSPADIPASLNRQAAALMRGDETGWLATVDPDQPAVVATFRYQYASLRALGVTGFQAVVAPNDLAPYVGVPDVLSLSITVRFGYCIQVDVCPPAHWAGQVPSTESYVALITFGLRNGAYVITGYEPQAVPDYDPPWLNAAAGLTIVASDRVVVVAPPSLADEVNQVLRVAGPAATVADRYARWVRPTRYVVYLADRPQWTTWFGGNRGDLMATGMAESVSSSAVPVVLNYAAVSVAQLPSLLRHEFGHVATLLGATPVGSYLAEGIADMIEHDGEPLRSYDRLPGLRQYVYSGAWNGDIDSASTSASADPIARGAAYAIGFFTWHCIRDRYGEAAMFDFAGRTLRDHDSAAKAAPLALGVAWSDVKTACADYIRAAL